MNETLLQRIKQRYGIVGNAEGLNRAIDVALKIAPVDLSVLIMGENGVGKEIFPRIIHDNSARKTKKYFAVNCGAIPEGTIDSELFGHEKGAFTGAVEKREGYFSVADGGTLFLDEVGELPLQTQARLLRVLETGEFIPVGSSQVKKTDVRIVAATNVNMDRAISDGKFREDLYYRLNSILITIPPLRERGEDATLLFRKFALDMSEKYKMPPIRLTEDAKAVLMHYSWPGNIRQLRNVAENMSVTAEEREITAEVLRQYIPEERPHNQLVVSDPQVKEHSFENEREILYQILFDLRRDVTELKKTVNEQLKGQSCDLSDRKGLPAFNSHYVDPQTFAEAEEVRDGEETKPILSLEEQEREAIGRVLEQNKGNRKLTAEQLGISERTLYRKIKEYDLEN
ncbi:sigma-54-dependent Fis family transcriptional regulator [Alloprevotella tannerae]|uniref:sigma-54 interaction domain-containing protein n=1 Tax=Alloprevotella tannerae TaxID=76122 RepID=UPI001EDA676D|nr:sigma-54 dependent transcriptional regulator [Alloprevotella tannerae]MCG2646327.1 sigma-54-dependent Fis family transcriptional regulator [Alloprevotella tannerae]MCG2647933.1 sigma-54-dependent Fis family transcriptional regulator [Alloprevotella tannerae]MCG2651781.1 sigma-54-dependent Fis family transcriptional regulator [Alloprevotella tannerae]